MLYFTCCHLTLSWRGPLSYRNQFLYDNGLRQERVNLRSCCIIPGVAGKFKELLSSFTNCHVMARVYFMFSPLSASLSTTSLIRFGRKTFYQTKKHYSSVKARALISNMVIKMFTSLQHFNFWKSIVTQDKCKCYGFHLTNLYMKHC